MVRNASFSDREEYLSIYKSKINPYYMGHIESYPESCPKSFPIWVKNIYLNTRKFITVRITFSKANHRGSLKVLSLTRMIHFTVKIDCNLQLYLGVQSDPNGCPQSAEKSSNCT